MHPPNSVYLINYANYNYFSHDQINEKLFIFYTSYLLFDYNETLLFQYSSTSFKLDQGVLSNCFFLNYMFGHLGFQIQYDPFILSTLLLFDIPLSQ